MVIAAGTRTQAVAMALLIIALPSSPLGGQAPPLLTASSVVEADLKAGDLHRYQIELTAGQYFSIAIDQQGIDVRPIITAPDGTKVYEYDYGEWGVEPAAVLAGATGTYQLDIRPEVAAPPPGKYRLRVDALRSASSEDEARARVIQRQVEAFPLIRSKATDFRRALPIYRDLLEAWQALGDGFGEAHVLTVLRFAVGELDDRTAAIDYARREVAAYGKIGHDYGEARALRSVGIMARALGDHAEALEALERSVALHRAAGRTSSENLLLADIANSHGAAGDFGAALEYAYDAIRLARSRGDVRLEGRSTLVAADAHKVLGEAEIAIDLYKRTRALASNDPVTHADAGARMGGALLSLDDLDGAEPLLDEGLAVWRKLGYRAQESQTLISLAELYARRNQLTRARETLELALTRAVESQYPLGEVIARRKLGDVLLKAGEIEPAAASFEGAALLFDKLANPNLHAMVYADRARIDLARRDLPAARRHAGQAFELAESLRGRAQSPRIQSALLASSQTVYETAVGVLMASHAAEPDAGHNRRALEVSEAARARSLLELVLESTRSAQGSDTTLLDQLRRVQQHLNTKAQALEAAQRGKNAATIAALSRDVDELSASFALLQQRVRVENPALAAVVNPAPLTVDAIQRDVLDASTVLVEYLLDEPRSYAWVVSRDAVASYELASRSTIEEALRAIGPMVEPPAAGSSGQQAVASTAALSRLLLDPIRRIAPGRRLLIVAPGMLQHVPFAALALDDRGREPLMTRHEIVYAPSVAVVHALRSVANTRAVPSRTLAVFADPVFESDDPRVASSAPGTPAPAAPGAMAPGTAAPAPVATVPSPVSRAFRGIVEGADRGGLSRIPFTRIEADRIASLVPARGVLKATGFSANLRAVTDGSLENYRIVHFATHGVLNTRTPDLSGLVFSLVDARGRPQEGFLRLHDLDRLRLNADLVVLSGCDTARGRRIEGEGIIGLTRGFIAAGARRVVGSLWRVDDLATAELMHAFYTAMLQKKLTAPAALRAAQQRMAASPRWAHPYFWAGFVIQGEWR